MKLGIIIDSASGLTKKEAEKRGWGFLPLYLNIDGKDYAEGIDLHSDNLEKTLTLESKVRTSASTPGEAVALFEKFSKKYDEVIVVPLSTELSSQNNNLKAFAKEFKNVHVVTSRSLSIPTVIACERAEDAHRLGKSLEEVINVVEETSSSFYGIVAPLTLDWLVKGGRINSSIASMANMLKIVPLIKIENGKLDKYGKGRTFNKSILKILKEFKDDKEIIILHSNNKSIDKLKEMIEEEANKKVILGKFPASITMHIGIGAVAICRIAK